MFMYNIFILHIYIGGLVYLRNLPNIVQCPRKDSNLGGLTSQQGLHSQQPCYREKKVKNT